MKFQRPILAAAIAVGAIAAVADAAQAPRSFTAQQRSNNNSNHSNKKALHQQQQQLPTKSTNASDEGQSVNPMELLATALATRRIEVGVVVGVWCVASLVRNARNNKRQNVQECTENPPGIQVHPLDDDMAVPPEALELDIVTSPTSEDALHFTIEEQEVPVIRARPEQAIVDACNPYMDLPAAQEPQIQVQVMENDLSDFMNGNMMRGGESTNSAMKERLKVGMYFGIWYALNVFYNIVNKKVLNVLPAPLVVGTGQLGIGALYAGLVWFLGLRAAPKLTAEGKSRVTQVGLYHSLGQLASMMSLGAGPVSFTHIVKALEPFFSAVVSGLYFGKWMKPQVYATLIPVVGGVGYACLKERSFSWMAFSAAMASNLAFALRAVVSKLALQSGRDAGINLTPQNMFGVVTWASFILSIPIALMGEGAGFAKVLSAAFDKVDNNMHFIRSLLLSGFLHYLNNEVMYLALGSVHPVTLAVGNTMKRVFIMVASVMVFKNPISLQAGIGSAVGISGVLLYSLTKQYFESLEAKEAAAAKSSGPRPFRSLPKPFKRGGKKL